MYKLGVISGSIKYKDKHFTAYDRGVLIENEEQLFELLFRAFPGLKSDVIDDELRLEYVITAYMWLVNAPGLFPIREWSRKHNYIILVP